MDQTGKDKKKKREKRVQLFVPLVACMIGILLNVGGKLAGSAAGLPFYFDTGGTILVSFLGGYVPGILVALVTNLLNYFSDSVSIYYGLFNVLIAVAAGYMGRKKYYGKAWRMLLFVVVLALIGGGFGGLLTWYLYGYDENAFTKPIIEFLQAAGWNIFGSWYVGTILLDFVDKLLTVIFVGVLLYLIPRRFWEKFELIQWMQEPLDDDDELMLSAKNGFSLNRKIVLILAIFSVAIASICLTICLILFRDYSIQQHTYLADGVSKLVASTVDGDSVDQYLAQGDDFDSYRETQRLLYSILNSTPDVEYVYVYKILPDGCHVVFDCDTEEQEGGKLGDVIPFDESFMKYLPDLLSGNPIDTVISNETYGWLLTSYSPVYDSNGDCVCYAATDIQMTEIATYEKEFLLKTISIFVGFLLFIFALALWLVKYHVILPINAMAHVADQFDYEDEFARKHNVAELSRLDIRTGDEIEHLYQAFLKTTEESRQYFEENQEKLEKIDAMQSSLVMVLADMVENRDGSTGDHVRKTAAYVGITARKMRELGYYKERLTDSFISDCEKSAPLHDIGKISIPDAILNKPGKLDDQEFAIMKTHASEGQRVIEQAIATMPDADYLEEAKNLAGYHHEKWNGTGYPNGFAEEEIPLSARIMAVADVFDALVSKRVYKDSFSYDKAFAIIQEDAGTHFDPLVADAFLKARDEVIEVAEQFAARGGKVE